MIYCLTERSYKLLVYSRYTCWLHNHQCSVHRDAGEQRHCMIWTLQVYMLVTQPPVLCPSGRWWTETLYDLNSSGIHVGYTTTSALSIGTLVNRDIVWSQLFRYTCWLHSHQCSVHRDAGEQRHCMIWTLQVYMLVTQPPVLCPSGRWWTETLYDLNSSGIHVGYTTTSALSIGTLVNRDIVWSELFRYTCWLHNHQYSVHRDAGEQRHCMIWTLQVYMLVTQPPVLCPSGRWWTETLYDLNSSSGVILVIHISLAKFFEFLHDVFFLL